MGGSLSRLELRLFGSEAVRPCFLQEASFWVASRHITEELFFCGMCRLVGWTLENEGSGSSKRLEAFASDRSHPRRLDFSDFIIPFDSSERACTFTYPACNAHAVCLAAPYFFTLSDKRLDFRRSYWTQNVFRFSLLLLFETFLIQRYIVVNVKTSSCKVLVVRIEF